MGALVMLWAAYSFSGKRTNDTFDKEGRLLQTGNFKEGKNHGKWTWFYQNGRKKLEGSFNMGSREGVWLTFDKNGDTLNKSYYIQDKLNGPFITYKKGSPIDTTIYINDVEVN
ncbi:MAG: toxin-antitoxin system YwqK family antitoxin [Flavobacteriales bacterium]